MIASCQHTTLSFASSSHSSQAGYIRPTAREREAAAILQTEQTLLKGQAKLKRTKASEDDADFGPFCAPLVLPGDDLAEDPEYPPQSLHEWRTDEDRNEVTPKQKTIYVVAPTADSLFRSWSAPKHADASIAPPNIADVVDYLSAFYYGMHVKQLQSPALHLSQWSTNPSANPRYVGLRTATESVRIRTRASRDGVFPRQLNLDDLLDAAISVLPDDAFSLLFLVSFDIYEGPDDDFCAGRAYGGSRVAVISTARYYPGLDRLQNVDRLHAWPTSHCKQFIELRCAEADRPDARRPKKKLKGKAPSASESASLELAEYLALSPLHAAVIAHDALPSLSEAPTAAALSALWLGRACRTASHELGHCLGIDHCVYYACAMQGTASLGEDARQPPFLCPVDLAKLLHATGASRESTYRAMLAFCDNHPDCHLFAALAAWTRAQLPDLGAKRAKSQAYSES